MLLKKDQKMFIKLAALLALALFIPAAQASNPLIKIGEQLIGNWTEQNI